MLRTVKHVKGLEDALKIKRGCPEDKENEVALIDKSGRSSKPTQVIVETPTPTNNFRLVSSNPSSKNSSSSYSPPPPYPNILKLKTKKMEEVGKEILNTFKKMEINK